MNIRIFISLIAIILCQETARTQSLESISTGLPAFASKFNIEAFNENVFIFDDQMDMQEIQVLIDTLYNLQHPRSSEFSSGRYALLFKPGAYQLDLKVGYYMSYIGLGKSPNDVVINGIILSKGEKNGNVTTNFWRSIENLTIETPAGAFNIWGVSQAAPMRRVHIKGDVQLHDNGWASGGFLADSKVDGTILAGGQQQWFTRNTEMLKWEAGSWNIMFMGVTNTPEDNWPDNPYTVIDATPFVREKPYLMIENSDYAISVPKLKTNSTGISWKSNESNEDVLYLDDFYIVKPNSDNSSTINAALADGKNLFFCPGIYILDQSLRISRQGTVVTGIGMPTLRPLNGNAVIEISDVSDVSVSSIIIDAGKTESVTLVRIGEPNSTNDHKENPTFLHDIFIRVGGYGEGRTQSCMEINSNNVHIDHTWLWRADHGNNVGWTDNTCKNGLIVNGDKVTVYGLFCEHFHEYQTLWNGNEGKVYFYQSEMPYDPPTAEAFNHGSTNGYASYKVSDGVESHEAWGLGIYCVFFKAPVIVDQAIETPQHIEKHIHRKLTYWLYGGHKESKIISVINGKGAQVDVNNVKTMMK